ncbi:unnamed protein product, partial [Brassica oleracea]
CTHVHIKSCCTFFAILFKEWHFSKYIFVFPRFFRVSCNNYCGCH